MLDAVFLGHLLCLFLLATYHGSHRHIFNTGEGFQMFDAKGSSTNKGNAHSLLQIRVLV
ncbi:hypothetical protein GALL_544750 [mine drainage metagenome]|uniref:Uncharacterized protein n=1 Tax=mine drainage metagenome TaxID=410659 RepID=A0A1J5NYX7_9ZZZZ